MALSHIKYSPTWLTNETEAELEQGDEVDNASLGDMQCNNVNNVILLIINFILLLLLKEVGNARLGESD